MPIDPQRASAAAPPRRTKTILLTLLVIVVLVLHHDWWFWKDPHAVFGFLPVGLAYHAAYSVLCSLLMWFLVRVAWPSHLENLEAHPSHPGSSQGGGH